MHSTLKVISSFYSLEAALKIVPLKVVKILKKIHKFLMQLVEEPSEKCVTFNILANPPAGSAIRADIIFVHGVFGSLVRTWKQGLWRSEGRTEYFQRARRPSMRPPKRRRASRSDQLNPPHRFKRRKPHVKSPSQVGSFDASDYIYSDEEFEINSTSNSIKSFRCFRSCDFDDGFESDQRSESSEPTSETGSDLYTPCWPRDWLPEDCPGVRVIAVNYTCDPYLWRPFWVRKSKRTTLAERSIEMRNILTDIGVGVGHPIVWVGHSKGGIYIKKMLVDAWESGKPDFLPLWKSARGCFFYSVPHRGSRIADFSLPLVEKSVELLEIEKDSPGVLELHRRFVALYRCGVFKLHVFSFVETALSLLCLRVVRTDSADPGIGEVCGVHLDHRSICKPRNRNCILYTKLTDMINKIC